MRVDFQTALLTSTKYHFGSFFVPASTLQFLSGPVGHAEVPARVEGVPFMYRTSDRFDTWLIHSGTTRSRQYQKSTMV